MATAILTDADIAQFDAGANRPPILTDADIARMDAGMPKVTAERPNMFVETLKALPKELGKSALDVGAAEVRGVNKILTAVPRAIATPISEYLKAPEKGAGAAIKKGIGEVVGGEWGAFPSDVLRQEYFQATAPSGEFAKTYGENIALGILGLGSDLILNPANYPGAAEILNDKIMYKNQKVSADVLKKIAQKATRGVEQLTSEEREIWDTMGEQVGQYAAGKQVLIRKQPRFIRTEPVAPPASPTPTPEQKQLVDIIRKGAQTPASLQDILKAGGYKEFPFMESDKPPFMPAGAVKSTIPEAPIPKVPVTPAITGQVAPQAGLPAAGQPAALPPSDVIAQGAGAIAVPPILTDADVAAFDKQPVTVPKPVSNVPDLVAEPKKENPLNTLLKEIGDVSQREVSASETLGRGVDETIKKNKEWIVTVLQQNKHSTDKELVQYFQEQGAFSKDTAEYIAAHRNIVQSTFTPEVTGTKPANILAAGQPTPAGKTVIFNGTLYHNTDAESAKNILKNGFKIEDTSTLSNAERGLVAGNLGDGVYLSPRYHENMNFVGEESNLTVKPKQPLRLYDLGNKAQIPSFEFVDNLKKQGYDGLIVNDPHPRSGGYQVVVFDPAKIKAQNVVEQTNISPEVLSKEDVQITPAEVPQKEPWQMDLTEYAATGGNREHLPIDTPNRPDNNVAGHDLLIKQAIDRGETIPDNVLAEYRGKYQYPGLRTKEVPQGKGAPATQIGTRGNLNVYQLNNPIKVTNTQGKVITLPKGETYYATPHPEHAGKIILKDGKQVTVFQEELRKLAGQEASALGNPPVGGGMVKSQIKDTTEAERQSKVHEMSESQLLRLKYQNQVRGAKYGYKAGKQEMQDVYESKQYRSALMNAIAKRGTRASTAPGVAIDYRNEAQKVFADFKKNYRNMTTEHLEEALDRLALIEKTGRASWSGNKTISEAKKEDIFQRLEAQAAKPYEARHAIRKPIGEGMPFGNKIVNSYRTARNKFTGAKVAITPIDTVIDQVLDGGQYYQGAHYTSFKRPLDYDFGTYHDLADLYKSDLIDMRNRLKIPYERFENIATRLYMEQATGYEKLRNAGHTDDEIQKGMDLNPAEMQMAQAIRKAIDEPYPDLQSLAKRVWNKELPKVKNYFPFITDWGQYDEAEMSQRLLDPEGASRGDYRTKTTPQPFMKERTGVGDQRLRMNAWDVAMKHLDDVAYALTMQEDIKTLFEVANSDRYRAITGDKGQQFMLNWLDTMARKGGAAGAQTIDVLDKLNRNVGRGMLAFKVASALIQTVKTVDAFPYIGDYTRRGISHVAMSQEWRDFAMQAPEIRKRIGDDIAYSQLSFGESKGAKLSRAGFWGLKQLDGLGAMSVYCGAYEKFMNEAGIPVDFLKPNQDAVAYAQGIVRRSKGGVTFKDTPQSITRGALSAAVLGGKGNITIDRTLLQFQNFEMARASEAAAFLRTSIKERDPYKLINAWTWILLGQLMVTGIRQGIRKATTGKSDWSVKRILLDDLTIIPFVGQLMSIKDYGALPVPSIETATGAAQSVAAMARAKTAAGKIRPTIQAAEDIASVVGVPGASQAGQIIRGKLLPPKQKGTATNNTFPHYGAP